MSIVRQLDNFSYVTNYYKCYGDTPAILLNRQRGSTWLLDSWLINSQPLLS